MRRFLFAIALAVVGSGLAEAQNSPTVATWDSVFRATFDAYDRRDWPTLSRGIDPRALATFKDDEVRMMQRVMEMTRARPSGSPRGLNRRSELAYYERLRAETERSSAESVFVREMHDRFDHDVARRPAVVRSIVGHVTEGDSLVHVVFRYRATWPALPSGAPRTHAAIDILTLRRADDRWRATLNGGLTWPVTDPYDMMNAVQ